MKASKTLVFIIATTISTLVFAADCTDVIALSKIKSEVVQGSSSLETAARNFCSEYSSAKTSGKTMKMGGMYDGLGASFGSGSVSADQVASKYCDASDQSKARSDAYRQYVESIAPGAFSAYERCVDLSTNGINISVDLNAILAKTFNANVSFRSVDSNATQEIGYTASTGVSCSWAAAGKSKMKLTLTPNTADVLECKRAIDTEQSLVTIFATSRASSQLSFKWDAYQNSLPVNLQKDLIKRVDQSVGALTDAANALKGSVVAFSLASCPAGWDEYTLAYGQFIRGIDRSGSGIDPEVNRLPGTLQLDDFKSHAHSRPDDVYDAGVITKGSVNGGNAYAYTYAAANGTPNTGPTGGSETRPKNVALLYCIRK
ncbi:hypothetical protein ACO0K9_20255 [Undibacterium sp. Ji50W]|uniref:hypothetical protein n=1 Tax=Undibacterium sp. Ji50W TaxID=3413041 RepID=UPI003BEF7681